MDKKIRDPVMYCINIPNCVGDRRRYFVAEKEVVDSVKKYIEEISNNGHNEAFFPKYSGIRVKYNPGIQDSLELIVKSRESAVLWAKEHGFSKLFAFVSWNSS